VPEASRSGRITVLSARYQMWRSQAAVAGQSRTPSPNKASGRGAAASIIVRMSLDFTECDQARLARDAAYDGRFYTGVHTTGIYCRPVCPVRPARSANVSFFPSAAAAEAAGFRPCLRCRPETAPFSSAWIGSRATVKRALRLIVEEGALDQEGATVERLAQRLGVGSRQLTRLFARYLQASPSKVARTARVQRAKRLLDETSLPMTEIAMRAGFGSLRRFNSRPPTKIRRTRGSAGKAEQTVEDVTKKKALFSPRARSGSAAAATSG
jgi:AraC family transcriptional regulator, regulatory protein of adaptative response / methylated-DNA-[protein]-cysteine methyltransferase